MQETKNARTIPDYRNLPKNNMDHNETIVKKIKVGISSCLLGERVRFDAGHKRNAYITDTLGLYFDFFPLCPEAAAGMGIPRPPIHLQQLQGKTRAIHVQHPELDVTEPLQTIAQRMLSTLPEDLCAYILKKDSPSCGMERVKVYSEHGKHAPAERIGTGIFAAALKEHYPHLPLEEEGRLGDPVLRENFIQRVYVYHRWKQLLLTGFSAQAFIDFHARHKYIIMAHDQTGLRQLGQIVAQTGTADLNMLRQQYLQLLMQLLSKRASRGQHTNVLQHLLGYLRKDLDKDDREELLATIAEYQRGYVPLIVPITLLKHHFRRHPNPYILQQHYLNPHPSELMIA